MSRQCALLFGFCLFKKKKNKLHCAFLFLVCLLKQISKYLCPSHFLVLLSCHCSALCHFATPCHKLCHFLTDEMQFPNAWTTNVPPLKYFSSLKILGVLWFFSQYIWKWSDAGLWKFERPTIRLFFCAHEERIYSLIYSLSHHMIIFCPCRKDL